MKRTLFIACVLAITFGCASFKSTVSETVANGVTNKVTSVHVSTLWNAKSELTKMGAGQTKLSQRISIASLTDESSSTNTTAAIESIVGAAVRAVVKP